MKVETRGKSNRRGSVSQSQLVSAFSAHILFCIPIPCTRNRPSCDSCWILDCLSLLVWLYDYYVSNGSPLWTPLLCMYTSENVCNFVFGQSCPSCDLSIRLDSGVTGKLVYFSFQQWPICKVRSTTEKWVRSREKCTKFPSYCKTFRLFSCRYCLYCFMFGEIE